MRLLLALATALALSAGAQAATALALSGGARAATAPPLGNAVEAVALQGSAWLALDKRALRLLDAQGRERARLAVRGKHLDGRATADGALATLLDADTSETLAISVDLQRGTLVRRVAVAAPVYSVEASCQYRDPQGHDHVFVVGDEGLTEQWLLRPEGALPVRRLALPPQTRQCSVDDRTQRLYALEEKQGVSIFNAEAEAKPRRTVLSGTATAHALKAWPGGLALADERGTLRLWRADAERLVALPTVPLSTRRPGEHVAVVLNDGQAQLAWRDETAKAWRATALRWPTPAPTAALPIVLPKVQTEPMARSGDAADDPAIWIHPSDPARSLILGTNKKQGLLVYDLAGRERQLLEVGRINNVDLRQRVRLDGRDLDIAVATQRDDFTVVVFTIDGEGRVAEAGRIPTGLKDIYGLCLHQPRDGGLQVFVNDKDGTHLRYALDWPAGAPAPQGRLLQRFALQSQPEACVADDVAGRLFIGEEKRGVWVMPLADLADKPALALVMPVGGPLHADVEGLAIYRGSGGDYLVVSSQGNNSYLVLDAAPPYRLRGALRIGIHLAAGIDGASETDGLEVTSTPLGPDYPRGALVVQDGFKRLPDGRQNFKIVDWRDVARALNLP